MSRSPIDIKKMFDKFNTQEVNELLNEPSLPEPLDELYAARVALHWAANEWDDGHRLDAILRDALEGSENVADTADTARTDDSQV